MFEKTISKQAAKGMALLGKSKLLEDAYMAGGTALALQIGHRLSRDFDFFTPKEFKEDIFVQRIKKSIPDFILEKMEWGTILGHVNKTRFSLFYYNYPLLFEMREFLGIRIADIKDIASMKIAAIADRGTKRDFVDLFFIIKIKQILPLKEILDLYDKKFKTLKQNRMHILKSLNYFDDADQEEMPEMFEDVSWREIKKFFDSEVKKISNELL